MPDEASPAGIAVAGHDLQDARREDLLRQLDEAQHRQRRLLGRLEIWTLPAASAGPIFQIAMKSG